MGIAGFAEYACSSLLTAIHGVQQDKGQDGTNVSVRRAARTRRAQSTRGEGNFAARFFTRTILFAVCYSLLGTAQPGFCQIETGGVTGTVRDSSGAVVPGVPVELINEATNVAAIVKSTGSGTYVFSFVQPGSYRLHVQAPGFKEFIDTGIVVNLQHTDTIDIPLAAGDVKQEVTVSAAAPLLQAEDASVGTTIDSRTVNDLPLNGRDWVSLSQLSAGVATSPVGVPSSNGGTPGSAFFSVDGVNLWQNDIRLDGIDDNIEFYGGSSIGTNAVVTPPPDAIEEFRLQNGDFSAEFGHSTGGIVNAVIRSGTNNLHGNLWEYLRNDVFDANDYFSKQRGLPIPEYRQNQFGGTIGGPVRIPGLYNGKDKTFFFGDYQGTRIVLPHSATSTVPTAGMVSSGFTNLQDLITDNSGTRTDALGRLIPLGTILDPQTTRQVGGGAVDPITGLTNKSANSVSVRDPFYTGSLAGQTNFTGAPTRLNNLPANRLDPNAIKLLGLYPLPNAPGFANNYLNNARETQITNQYDIRIDQNFSERDIVFGVFDQSFINYAVPGALPGVAVGQNGGENQAYPSYMVAVGYTHLFSPSLTNDFHFGFGHSRKDQTPVYGAQPGIPAQFGIAGVPAIAGNGGLPAIDFNGLNGSGGISPLGTISDRPTIQTVYDTELTDTITKTLSKHSVKAGVQIDLLRGNILQPQASKGIFAFTGQFSDIPNQTGALNGISDLLLVPGSNGVGGLSLFAGSNYAGTNDSRHYIGAFAQDDWKATPNLTLNLGVRWDYFSPYVETSGRQANFLPVGGNGNSGTFLIPNQGCQVPRSASFNALLAGSNITLQCTGNASLGNAQDYNFAPRVGFAYRLRPDFVVRGGYGIAYGALGNLGYGGTLGTNYPFEYVIAEQSTSSQAPITLATGATATIENTLPTINLQDPTQVSGIGVSLYGRQFDYQTPYTQTFNLTVQEQFTGHDSFQIGYVGNLGRHLDNLGTTNSPSQILTPGTPIQQHIPFPKFSPNSTYETTDGESAYNSLQTTYTHQFSSGFSVLANYTFSKCFSDQKTQATAEGGYRAEWLPGFGIKGDYGLCDVDVTDVVHFSGTARLPVGRGRQFLGSANRAVDALIGGWAFNYIYTFQSGQPFTVGCPVATSSDFGCNADVVPGLDIYAGAHRPSDWLNAAAFTQPGQAAQNGQIDYSILGGKPQQARGPYFNNLDASLFKDFTLREAANLEFRAEAFNLSNTPQFGQPGNLDFSNTTSFSRITTLRNQPRLLQLALKLAF